jgi:methionyl-tRNA synthetase
MEKEIVKFSDWQKLDLRVGKILNAEEVEGADRLYKLEIDLGSEKRTLIAGLKPFYPKDKLKGKLCVVFTNLEPRTIRGTESKGMILAATNSDISEVKLLQPDENIEPGSRIN